MTHFDEPLWFDKEVVMIIHDRQLAEHGGSDGIRDDSLLESALGRSRQLWAFWAYSDPDLFALAASYAFGLAKNHPFIDGNQRTAAVICEAFIELHRMEVKLDENTKYPEYLALAAGEHSEESFATWLREKSAPLGG